MFHICLVCQDMKEIVSQVIATGDGPDCESLLKAVAIELGAIRLKTFVAPEHTGTFSGDLLSTYKVLLKAFDKKTLRGASPTGVLTKLVDFVKDATDRAEAAALEARRQEEARVEAERLETLRIEQEAAAARAEAARVEAVRAEAAQAEAARARAAQAEVAAREQAEAATAMAAKKAEEVSGIPILFF